MTSYPTESASDRRKRQRAELDHDLRRINLLHAVWHGETPAMRDRARCELAQLLEVRS